MQTCALAPAILGATDKAETKAPVMGSGKHTYEAIHDWGELPAGIKYGNTHGVVEDAQGQIYVHHTVHASSEIPDSMVVFDEKGKFVKSWGKEFKGGAHGLHIQKEGSTEYLYLCDTARGIVMKATLNGEAVYTLGYPDQSEAYKPGADGKKPKYSPTNLAIAPNGDLYVGDGYGSSYINQYNNKGEYIRTFGGKGKEAGRLDCPHGIIVDRREGTPILTVADRGKPVPADGEMDGGGADAEDLRHGPRCEPLPGRHRDRRPVAAEGGQPFPRPAGIHVRGEHEPAPGQQRRHAAGG